MDKVEYRELIRSIKNRYLEQDYESVIEISDQLELEKIRENSILEIVAKSYEALGRSDLAKETLLIAYKRTPTGKRIAYNLATLCIKLDDLDSAVMFYEDFCKMAPKDNQRLLLKYEIGRAGGVPTKDLIRVLETYNAREMDDKWQYELARLYHEIGDGEKCAAVCDQICLWYANGEYEKKALELKNMHKALNPTQQARFEEIMQNVLTNGSAKSLESEDIDLAEYLSQEKKESPEETPKSDESEVTAAEEEVCSEVMTEDAAEGTAETATAEVCSEDAAESAAEESRSEERSENAAAGSHSEEKSETVAAESEPGEDSEPVVLKAAADEITSEDAAKEETEIAPENKSTEKEETQESSNQPQAVLLDPVFVEIKQRRPKNAAVITESLPEIDYNTEHLAPQEEETADYDDYDDYEDEEDDDGVVGQISLFSMFESLKNKAVKEKNRILQKSKAEEEETDFTENAIDEVIEPEIPLLNREDVIEPADDGGEDIGVREPEFEFEKIAAEASGTVNEKNMNTEEEPDLEPDLELDLETEDDEADAEIEEKGIRKEKKHGKKHGLFSRKRSKEQSVDATQFIPVEEIAARAAELGLDDDEEEFDENELLNDMIQEEPEKAVKPKKEKKKNRKKEAAEKEEKPEAVQIREEDLYIEYPDAEYTYEEVPEETQEEFDISSEIAASVDAAKQEDAAAAENLQKASEGRPEENLDIPDINFEPGRELTEAEKAIIVFETSKMLQDTDAEKKAETLKENSEFNMDEFFGMVTADIENAEKKAAKETETVIVPAEAPETEKMEAEKVLATESDSEKSETDESESEETEEIIPAEPLEEENDLEDKDQVRSVQDEVEEIKARAKKLGGKFSKSFSRLGSKKKKSEAEETTEEEPKAKTKKTAEKTETETTEVTEPEENIKTAENTKEESETLPEAAENKADEKMEETPAAETLIAPSEADMDEILNSAIAAVKASKKNDGTAAGKFSGAFFKKKKATKEETKEKEDDMGSLDDLLKATIKAEDKKKEKQLKKKQKQSKGKNAVAEEFNGFDLNEFINAGPQIEKEFSLDDLLDEELKAKNNAAGAVQQAQSQKLIFNKRYKLNREQRKAMAEFLLLNGMEEPISAAIEKLVTKKKSGDETGGHLIIAGDADSKKTLLAVEILKAVNQEVGHGNSRVAKVQGQAINGKNVKKILAKVTDSDLIIENVGKLEDDTIRDLITAVRESEASTMVILEGNELAIDMLIQNFPDIAKIFKTRINIHEQIPSKWTDLALRYANSQGYSIDHRTLAALRKKFDFIDPEDLSEGFAQVRSIVDGAIEKAEKPDSEKLFSAFSKKNEDILIPLEEEHFM